MATGRRHREHFRDLPVAGVTAPCPHGHAGPHQAACVSPVSVSRLPETFQLRRAKGNGVRFFRRSGLQREIRQHALPSLSRRNVWKWCPRDLDGKGGRLLCWLQPSLFLCLPRAWLETRRRKRAVTVASFPVLRDHRRSESTKAGLLRAFRPHSRPRAAPAAEEVLRDTCHVRRELLSSIPIKYGIKPKLLSTDSEVAPRAPDPSSCPFRLPLGDRLGPSSPGPRLTIASPMSRESRGQDTAVQWVPCLLSSQRAPDLGH